MVELFTAKNGFCHADPMTSNRDDQAAIYNAIICFNERTMLIWIYRHLVWDKVLKQTFQTAHVRSHEWLAGLSTKLLGIQMYKCICRKLRAGVLVCLQRRSGYNVYRLTGMAYNIIHLVYGKSTIVERFCCPTSKAQFLCPCMFADMNRLMWTQCFHI